MNHEFERIEKRIVFTATLIAFGALLVYNALAGSQWVIDATMTVALLGLIMFSNKWLHIDRTGFILVVIGLVLHNLGSFGAYEGSWGRIGYDTFVHLIGGLASAYIAFNLLTRRLSIQRYPRLERRGIKEERAWLLVLVVALVALLGVGVEFMEFGGALFLGEGEGILFAGPGDYGPGPGSNYFDTMTDLLANTIGAVIGAVLFWFVGYRRARKRKI